MFCDLAKQGPKGEITTATTKDRGPEPPVDEAVGNAFLQVIEVDSRISAQQAQVESAKALYEQVRDEEQAGTAPRIDVTRTEIQFPAKEYNLSIACNDVPVAKQNVHLANENLARSKDCFISGATDSVGVVQAEQSLASANDQYITSLYNHNLAKRSLAHWLAH